VARRFFERADAPLQRKLDRCFDQLRRNIKRLKGEFAAYRRYRVGDWRVIYRIEEARRRVIVLDIAHRRDVYE
jgi:mRNA interferase RelE/StbE